MKLKTVLCAGAIALGSATAAQAAPASFIDLGSIGSAGSFVFDTTGSSFDPTSGRSGSVDTELAIWDSAGNLLASDDDDGPGLFSEISINLSDGFYFLGISEFNSVFADNFLNTETGFEQGEIADLVLNEGGNQIGFFDNASDQLDQETAFFRVAVGEVSAVPLPAGGLLLLSGLGAFAATRRRKAS